MNLDPDEQEVVDVPQEEEQGPVLRPESEALVQKGKGPPVIFLLFLVFAVLTAVWKKMVVPVLFPADKVIEQPLQSSQGDRSGG